MRKIAIFCCDALFDTDTHTHTHTHVRDTAVFSSLLFPLEWMKRLFVPLFFFVLDAKCE